MSSEFKEISTEQLTESLVGRPLAKQADVLALDDILRSKEKREALLKELKRFSKETELQKDRAKNLNDDIKAVAQDTFKLSVKKFKELMSAIDGDVDEVIQLLTSTVDTLEILNKDNHG